MSRFVKFFGLALKNTCYAQKRFSAILSKKMENITYPSVRRDESIVDNIFGVKIKDPYRWLEDPDSAETRSFVDAQNKISMAIVREHPLHQNIEQRFKMLDNFPKEGIPWEIGHISGDGSSKKRYLFYYNEGLQDQSVLYMKDNLAGGISESRVILNPNEWAEKGTSAIKIAESSYDGNILAYMKSEKGSDWATIHFINLDTLEHYTDVLCDVRYSGLEWTGDNKGVFYNRYDRNPIQTDGIPQQQEGIDNTPAFFMKLYYHELGTDQKDDILIWDYPQNKERTAGVTVSLDFNFLILSVHDGCSPNNLVWYVDLRKLKGDKREKFQQVKDSWKILINEFEATYTYVNNEDNVFTFLTSHSASKYKLINIDFSDPDCSKESSWKDLVSEAPDMTIMSCSCVNENYLLLHCIKDVLSLLQIRDARTGKLIKELKLEIGTVSGITGHKNYSDAIFQMESMTSYRKIYRLDMNSKEFEPQLLTETKIPGYDSSALESKQVFYKSKDGTTVPMFLLYKKGIELNGNNPTILYGYGGFRISLFATFSLSRTIWCQNMNGIYAVANIRGGGEYGDEWYTSAKQNKKQTSYDDFQAAAEYLIQSNYTSSNKLAMQGGSNGGLLVGICTLQRPDLYAAAISHVGVFDILRFHKFTIGHAWKSDYGNPDVEEDFKSILKRSPLHLVEKAKKDVTYPAMLFLTADHDDRVPPLNSYKYVAELQYRLGNSSNPILLVVDTDAGHGAGKPKWKSIQEMADVFCFAAKYLGADWTDS